MGAGRRRCLGRIGVVLCAAAVGCAAEEPQEACAARGPAGPCHAPDPGAPGPYPVGVTTVLLEDTSRQEPGGGPRPLQVELWYPAVASSLEAPREVYSLEAEAPEDLLEVLSGHGLAFPPIDAARDAEPDRGGAPYPLLTFSHGKNGIRFQTASVMVHLASHGYVVAAPDHTRDTLWELLREEDVGAEVIEMLIARPEDLSFVATWLERDGGPLAGLADVARWGVLGHSFGGTTSIVIASERGGFTDRRVRAFAPITPAAAITTWIGAGTQYKRAPMWLVAAVDDRTLDYETDQLLAYTGATAPRGMVAIDGAGHFSFTDLCALDLVALEQAVGVELTSVREDGCGEEFIPGEDVLGITRFFLTAFFNAVLRASGPAGEDLRAEALPQAWGELVTVETDGL